MHSLHHTSLLHRFHGGLTWAEASQRPLYFDGKSRKAWDALDPRTFPLYARDI